MYLLLFVLWLVFNGRITPEILLIGLGLTGALGVLSWALLGYTPRHELRLLRRVGLFLVYLAVLFRQIVRANLSVVGRVLRPKRIDPALITFRVSLRSEFARFILANSITLTPGTLTVQSRGEELTVHCLHPELLEGIEEGVFVRLLRKMEE